MTLAAWQGCDLDDLWVRPVCLRSIWTANTPLPPIAAAIASPVAYAPSPRRGARFACGFSPCPLGGMAGFRKGAKCEVFEWRSDDTAVVAAGRAKLLERKMAAVGHKTAVLWEKQEDLPDGVRLVWRKPVTHAAGYAWFCRNSGELVRSVLVGG